MRVSGEDRRKGKRCSKRCSFRQLKRPQLHWLLGTHVLRTEGEYVSCGRPLERQNDARSNEAARVDGKKKPGKTGPGGLRLQHKSAPLLASHSLSRSSRPPASLLLLHTLSYTMLRTLSLQ